MKIYDVKLSYSVVGEALEPIAINMPQIAVSYMNGAFDSNPEQESFWVILLDRRNKPKGRIMVTLGTATNALVHPREVFRAAILGSATAIICVHNHPSGDPTPSGADNVVTRQLREAAKTVDIVLQDHIVIGRASADPLGNGFYSYRQAGLL